MIFRYYLDKMFQTSKIKNTNNFSIKFPKWDWSIMFLKSLDNNTIDNFGEFRKEIYRNKIGDLETKVKTFFKNGIISKPNAFECINKNMTTVELKKFLRTNNEKVTGKKLDLINSMLNIITEEEKISLVNSSNFIVITEYGKSLIKNDSERFDYELEIFDNIIFNLIYSKEIEQATKLVAEFYSTYPFPIGLGTDWSRGFSNNTKLELKHIMNSNYITENMNMPKSIEINIRARICTDQLFSYLFRSKNNSKKILELWPNFNCTYIEEYLKENPKNVFGNYKMGNKELVVAVFRHAIYFEASNKISLDYFLNSNIRDLYKGIIVSGCNTCNTDKEYYTWNDIANLPKLPKRPICTCYYHYIPRNLDDK